MQQEQQDQPHGQCQGEHEHHVISEEEEHAALLKIIHAFRDYQVDAGWEVSRWEYHFSRLPDRHKQLLASQHEKFRKAREAIHVNHFFIQSMLAAFDPHGALQPRPPRPGQQPPRVVPGDVEKVRYVLKNLARDWSAEGAPERAQAYGRICAELKRCFAAWPEDAERPPRVLLPGAGLARLCCEVAGMGFEAQGNEFSYYMLIASSFILNDTLEPDQYTIHPWVTATCNQLSDEEQLRGVTIPDVHPASIVTQGGLLSMAAGDFVEVYGSAEQAGQWDAVVTCFFIDTAHNVVQYLEVIHNALKPGGVWVNLGPLLYHWAESSGVDELSVELSLGEIRRVAQAMGFRLDQEQVVDAGYIANSRSMYKTVYQASFWTMVKEGVWPPLGSAPLHTPPPPPPRPLAEALAANAAAAAAAAAGKAGEQAGGGGQASAPGMAQDGRT